METARVNLRVNMIRMERRRKMSRAVCVLMVLGFLAGCSTMKVVTDYSESADFSRFKTFQYKETDMTIADTNPLAHRRIVNAIRQEMIASGLTEVDSDPDVYVTYYGKVNEQIILHSSTMGYRHGSRWRSWGRVGHPTTVATTYLRGTLVIDIWKAEQKELVWRGVVSDAVSGNPDRNTARINRGISSVFERFPPASAS
jgi:hypothetical protein